MADDGASATLSAVSDYDYRGITLSADGPALQPTLEYTAAPLHLQVWARNVALEKPRTRFGAGHTEVVWTADLAGGTEQTLEYDVGVDYFTYPGAAPDKHFGELFGTLTRDWLSASLHLARNYDNLHPWLSASYIEGNGKWPIAHSAYHALAHAGESWGPYWRVTKQGSFFDYFVGADRETGHITLSLRRVGTRRYTRIPYGEPFSGTARIVFALSLTLP